LGHAFGGETEQRSDVLAQVAVGKTAGQETKEDQGSEQRQDALIAEAKRRGMLAVALDGVMDLVERVFADRAVVADSLDVQETSGWR
jgi:hypothetical protein